MGRIIALVPALLLFANCYTAQAGLPSNTFYGYNSTGLGFSGQFDSGSYRSGEACATSMGVLWGPLVAWGDASVRSAARKAGITKIQSVSHRTSFGHVLQDYCTVVRGF